MKQNYQKSHEKVDDVIENFDIHEKSSQLNRILAKTTLDLWRTLSDELFVDGAMKKKLNIIKGAVNDTGWLKTDVDTELTKLEEEKKNLKTDATITKAYAVERSRQIEGKLKEMKWLKSWLDKHRVNRAGEYEKIVNIATNIVTGDVIKNGTRDVLKVNAGVSTKKTFDDIYSQMTSDTANVEFLMGDVDGKRLSWDADNKWFVAELETKTSGIRKVAVKGMTFVAWKLSFKDVQLVEPSNGDLIVGEYFKQPLEFSVTSKTSITDMDIKVCNIKKLKINLEYPINKKLADHYDDVYFGFALENFYTRNYDRVLKDVVKKYIEREYPADFSRLEAVINDDPKRFLAKVSGWFVKVDCDDIFKAKYKEIQTKQPTKTFVNEREYKDFLQKDLEKKMDDYFAIKITEQITEEDKKDGVVKNNLKGAIMTKTDLETVDGREKIIDELNTKFGDNLKMKLDLLYNEEYLKVQKKSVMEVLKKEKLFKDLPENKKNEVYNSLDVYLRDVSLAEDVRYHFSEDVFYKEYVKYLAKDKFFGTIEEYKDHIKTKFYEGYEDFFGKLFKDRLETKFVPDDSGGEKKAKVFLFEKILNVDNLTSRVKNKSVRESVFDNMNVDYDMTRVLPAWVPREEFDSTLYQKYNFNYHKQQRDEVFAVLKQANSTFFDEMDDNGKRYLYERIVKKSPLTSPSFNGPENEIIKPDDLDAVFYKEFKDFVVDSLPSGVKSEFDYQTYLTNNMTDLAEKFIKNQLEDVLGDADLLKNIKREFFYYRKSMDGKKVDDMTESDALAIYIDNNKRRLDPVYSVWPMSKMTNYTTFFSGHTASLPVQTFDITDKWEEKSLKYSMDLNFTSVNNVRADIEIDGKKLALKDKTPFRLASGILKDNRVPYGKLRMNLAFNIMKLQIKKATELGLWLQFKTTSGKLGSFEFDWDNLVYAQTDPISWQRDVIFDEQDFKNNQNIGDLRAAMEWNGGWPGLLMLFSKWMRSLNNGYKTAISRLTLPKKPLRYNTKWLFGTRWFRRMLNNKVNTDFNFSISAQAGDKNATINFENWNFEVTVSGYEKEIKAKNLWKILRMQQWWESLFAGIELEIIQKVNQELLKQLHTNTRIKKRAYWVLDEYTWRVYVVDQDGDISYISPNTIGRNRDPRSRHIWQNILSDMWFSSIKQSAWIIKYRNLPGNRIPLDQQWKKEFFTNPILCGRVLKRMAGRLGPVGWL